MSIIIVSGGESDLVETIANRTDIEVKHDETAFPTLYVATVFGKFRDFSRNKT